MLRIKEMYQEFPAQFEFFRHVSFSPPLMDHQWSIDGPSMEKLFWIQILPMDGPWVDHASPCMGVHGFSVRKATWIYDFCCGRQTRLKEFQLGRLYV